MSGNSKSSVGKTLTVVGAILTTIGFGVSGYIDGSGMDSLSAVKNFLVFSGLSLVVVGFIVSKTNN